MCATLAVMGAEGDTLLRLDTENLSGFRSAGFSAGLSSSSNSRGLNLFEMIKCQDVTLKFRMKVMKWWLCQTGELEGSSI